LLLDIGTKLTFVFELEWLGLATPFGIAQLFCLVLDIGPNSDAVNFSANKKCNHSNRAKCAARHDDKKTRVRRTFSFAHFFTFSPNSIISRAASDRDKLRFLAHTSTAAKTSLDTRAEIAGLSPVAGRPRFLSTDMVFFMITVYTKGKQEGSGNFRPRLRGIGRLCFILFERMCGGACSRCSEHERNQTSS
jgi:hypothetical protein